MPALYRILQNVRARPERQARPRPRPASAVKDRPIFYQSVQAGRGLAALLVVLFHASVLVRSPKYWGVAPLNGAFLFGHAGVYFFFVLSGFIIFSAHARDIGRPERLPAYLRHRAARIYPPLWAAILLVLPVLGLSGQAPSTTLVARSALLVAGDARSMLAVGWTLFHEIAFYLVFAVLLVRRRLGMVALVLWAAACLSGWQVGYWTSPLNLLFGAGIASALLTRRSAIPAARSMLISGAILFAGTGAVQLARLGRPIEPGEVAGVAGYVAAYGTASCLMLIGAVAAERADRLVVPGGLRVLGNASYSLYLVHYPVLSAAAKAIRRLPAEAAFCLLVIVAVVAGLIFHLLIEQPLLRVLSGQRRRANGTAA